MSKTIRVATDVGGTFTDLVCFETDHATGESRITTAKSDTTPPNFEQGVLNVLEKGGVDPRTVDFLAHGTTVVINALTERKGGGEADNASADDGDVDCFGHDVPPTECCSGNDRSRFTLGEIDRRIHRTI